MVPDKKTLSAKNVSARYTRDGVTTSQEDIIAKDLTKIVEDTLGNKKKAKEGYVKF